MEVDEGLSNPPQGARLSLLSSARAVWLDEGWVVDGETLLEVGVPQFGAAPVSCSTSPTTWI